MCRRLWRRRLAGHYLREARLSAAEKTLFRIELLPALHGDCIWIEYGDPAARTRIIIDGGPIGAYKALDARVAALKPGDREMELLAVTHVDGDHIEGAVRLIADKAGKLSFREVWFNGWRHLEKVAGILGPVQGEFVSALITKFIGDSRWNASKPFSGGALVVGDGALPVATLEGGMRLTLLSPTPLKLENLRQAWTSDVTKRGFSPGDLDAALALLRTQHRLVPKGLLGGSYQLGDQNIPLDDAVANGSSLAMLAEFDGKSCLLLGDAHPDVVMESLKRLGATVTAPLKVNAVKIAHHGSRRNTSPDLLRLVECKRFLISTNGNVFHHPDQETVDTVIDIAGAGVSIMFNYLSDTTRRWSDKSDQTNRQYSAIYPQEEGAGAVIEL